MNTKKTLYTNSVKIFFYYLCGIVIFPSISMSQTPLKIQSSSSLICPGTSVTLSAVGGTGGYTWMPGNTTSQLITVSPITTTTYTLSSGTASVFYTVEVCQDAICKTMSTTTFNPLLLSTGNNGPSSILTYGQADLNWTFSTTSINGPYTPAIVSDNAHIPGIYSKSIWSNTQWIGTNANLTSTASTYYFQTQFNLTAAEAATLILNMQFMADNTVMGVTVNKVLVPNSSTPGLTNYGFQIANASSATMKNNWVAGLNTITVQVNDLGGYGAFLAQLNPILNTQVQDLTSCTTLPIKFISFQGNNVSNKANLSWQVIMNDMNRFIIERSSDAINFTAIDTIHLENVEQNNVISTYDYTDEMSKGINYYRIIAYEENNTVTLSNTISIKNTNTISFQVSPNPNKGTFILSGTNSQIELDNNIAIFNSLGEVVFSKSFQSEGLFFEVPIDISNLAPGLYFVGLGYATPSVKIIKE